MGNSTRNQQRREIIKASVERAKQSTLDDMSFQFNVPRIEDTIKPSKAIIINRILEATKEDKLELRIDFSLLPSKMSFSKVNLDLYFQEALLKSASLIIPQSQLLNNNFEYPQVLEMKGVAAGEYLIRVEMYEPWSSGEKLNFTSKEITFQYVPKTRAERLVKIPTVKSVAGADLTVVSSTAKDIYREIEQDLKKESISKRDEW
jgi:hypothetical protein